MRCYFISVFSSFVATLLLTGCTNIESQRTKVSAKDSLIIFEKPVLASDTTNQILEIRSAIEKTNQEKSLSTKPIHFSVQIGAFSTLEKADLFAAQAGIKLGKQFAVTFNSAVNLFVVQLTPSYTHKPDAEAFKNALWEIKDYRDAWIVLVDE